MSQRSIPEALKEATSGDTYYVTRDQLFTSWADGTGGGQKLRVFVAFLAPIALYMLGAAHWGPMGPITVGAALFLVVLWAWSADVADEDTFEQALRDHLRRFGVPDKLLIKPRLAEPPPPAEADVHDHGVAGILLVDSDRLVDFLVLNGIHAQLGCAVVSINGYPEYILDPLRRVADTSNLFVLHSTDTSYATMADAARELFPDRRSGPTLDLGMGPRAFRWLKPRHELRRARVRRPSMLMPAWFTSLLRLALAENLSLGEAASRLAAAQRRRRGGSSHGDTHGWG